MFIAEEATVHHAQGATLIYQHEEYKPRGRIPQYPVIEALIPEPDNLFSLQEEFVYIEKILVEYLRLPLNLYILPIYNPAKTLNKNIQEENRKELPSSLPLIIPRQLYTRRDKLINLLPPVLNPQVLRRKKDNITSYTSTVVISQEGIGSRSSQPSTQPLGTKKEDIAVIYQRRKALDTKKLYYNPPKETTIRISKVGKETLDLSLVKKPIQELINIIREGLLIKPKFLKDYTIANTLFIKDQKIRVNKKLSNSIIIACLYLYNRLLFIRYKEAKGSAKLILFFLLFLNQNYFTLLKVNKRDSYIYYYNSLSEVRTVKFNTKI
ncbi:unnamed protein product [Clonostachys chloroleuca]|uniref:Uncharacterized protein n=1 Tax=Clonostachys chloroleuca TaxID=1926264 RepID=A0AA35VAE2_9HYPO|nr:unnamed protein product [Clonostachys chloroleuca]